jgi:hypothetical protein
MAECFCGCGRKVGITSRGMNKQGRRTVNLIALLRNTPRLLVRAGRERVALPAGQGA